jgi:hypothetical protein
LKLETLNRQRHGNKKYIYLVELYKEHHDVETVSLDEVTDWAMREGHYVPEPVDPRKILKRELARAMRNDYFVDDQGREVRKYHSVRHTESGLGLNGPHFQRLIQVI